LSKIFIEKGAEHDFLKMSMDEDPVVRCMGLLCLAQYDESTYTLNQHLTDTSLINYCPGGCSVSPITVGNFVRKLLSNVNDLDYRSPRLPIISRGALIALDIELLAKDSTSSFHVESARSLSSLFDAKETLPSLSHLEAHQLIKAIGRLGVSPKQRTFLVYCVQNEDLAQASRLAAASALTRDANETVLSVIRSERTNLNNMTQGNWGDFLLETLQSRISHEKSMQVVRELNWQREEHLDDRIVKAFSNSHPLALPDLTNDRFLRLGPHHNRICNIIGASLVEMSENLEKFNQPWNTYSDTAYALSFIMNVRKGNRLFDRIFTQARRSQIEKNIQKAIESHFEGRPEPQSRM